MAPILQPAVDGEPPIMSLLRRDLPESDFDFVAAAVPNIVAEAAATCSNPPTEDFVAATYRWMLQKGENRPSEELSQAVLVQVRKGTAWQPKNIGFAAWPIHICGPLARTAHGLKCSGSASDVMTWLEASVPSRALHVMSSNQRGVPLSFFEWTPAAVQKPEKPEQFHVARLVPIDRHGIKCASLQLDATRLLLTSEGS